MTGGVILEMKIFFIGAGPGDPDLITVKGKRLLERADTIIYPGHSINRELLDHPDATLINSWNLSFEEVIMHIVEEVRKGRMVVKLHSGDPSLFENASVYLRALSEHGIDMEIVPGVSSIFAAAASLKAELAENQTLIVTRPAGEPWRKDYRFESGSIKGLSKYGAVMAVFIGTSHIRDIMKTVDYPAHTGVAVVYHASQSNEQIITGTVSDIADRVEEAGIKRGAAILIGITLHDRGDTA